MTGAMVVVTPGSSVQLLLAVLIMLIYMLLILKTAPYDEDSEDWSSFIASIALTLTFIGGLVLIQDNPQDRTYEDGLLAIVLIMVNVTCVAIEVLIVLFFDCGLLDQLKVVLNKSKSDDDTEINTAGEEKISNSDDDDNDNTESDTDEEDDDEEQEIVNIFSSSSTKVVPINTPPPPRRPPPGSIWSTDTPTALARSRSNASHVVSINSDADKEEHDAHIESLHTHHEKHEEELKQKNEHRRRLSLVNTKSRVQARAELIRSKVMRKVRIFQQLDDQCLKNLIKHMSIRTFSPNEDIILQGSPATCFYIIISGTISVTQKTIDDLKGHEVAKLGEHNFFGEHALELGSNESHLCNATCTAIGMVRTMFMENKILEDLVNKGIINKENLIKGIQEEQERRERMTRVKLLMNRSGSFAKMMKKSDGDDSDDSGDGDDGVVVVGSKSKNERSLFS